MMPALTLVQLTLGMLLGGAPAPAKPPPHQVTIEVRVCEAMKLEFLFNDDAERRWSSCQSPLKGAQLAASQIGQQPRIVETDERGLAQLGPLSLDKDQHFAVSMIFAPTNSAVLRDLFVGGPVHDGQNKLLVFTGPSPAAGSTNGNGGS